MFEPTDVRQTQLSTDGSGRVKEVGCSDKVYVWCWNDSKTRILYLVNQGAVRTRTLLDGIHVYTSITNRTIFNSIKKISILSSPIRYTAVQPVLSRRNRNQHKHNGNTNRNKSFRENLELFSVTQRTLHVPFLVYRQPACKKRNT